MKTTGPGSALTQSIVPMPLGGLAIFAGSLALIPFERDFQVFGMLESRQFGNFSQLQISIGEELFDALQLNRTDFLLWRPDQVLAESSFEHGPRKRHVAQHVADGRPQASVFANI